MIQKAEDARLSELKLHQYYLYQINRLYFKEKTGLKGLFILLFPIQTFSSKLEYSLIAHHILLRSKEYPPKAYFS